MLLKKSFLFVAFTCHTLAYAGTMGAITDDLISGAYLGLGGSFNSVKNQQRIYASGQSTSFFANGQFAGTGQAAGWADPSTTNLTTFAPKAQLGYVDYFKDTRACPQFKPVF